MNFEQIIIQSYNRYMKHNNNKDARLEIKLTSNQKKLLEYEAKYYRTTVSELVRGLILKRQDEKKEKKN